MSKRTERERRMAPQVSGDLTPKIIDFELGRKALEKNLSEDEQRSATLVQRIRNARGGYRTIGWTVADDGCSSPFC